jgi:hypothetical protein
MSSYEEEEMEGGNEKEDEDGDENMIVVSSRFPLSFPIFSLCFVV